MAAVAPWDLLSHRPRAGFCVPGPGPGPFLPRAPLLWALGVLENQAWVLFWRRPAWAEAQALLGLVEEAWRGPGQLLGSDGR